MWLAGEAAKQPRSSSHGGSGKSLEAIVTDSMWEQGSLGAGEPPRRTSRVGSWRQGCRCGRHTGWASPGVLTTKPRESFAQPGVVTSPAQTQGAEPSNFPESRCPTRGGGLFLQKRVSPSPFLPDVHFCSNSVNDHQF